MVFRRYLSLGDCKGSGDYGSRYPLYDFLFYYYIILKSHVWRYECHHEHLSHQFFVLVIVVIQNQCVGEFG